VIRNYNAEDQWGMEKCRILHFSSIQWVASMSCCNGSRVPSFLYDVACDRQFDLTTCSEDELSQLNGSESLERRLDGRRSRSKEGDKASRGRETDPEKAARNSRNEEAVLARASARERVRLEDGDAGDERRWSPQTDEVVHEKLRVKEEGATRERRSKHRQGEPVLKVSFSKLVFIVILTRLFKVIWDQVASPTMVADLLIANASADPTPHPKPHLLRFMHFCTAMLQTPHWLQWLPTFAPKITLSYGLIPKPNYLPHPWTRSTYCPYVISHFATMQWTDQHNR